MKPTPPPGAAAGWEHRPTLAPDRIETLRQWHERAYAELRRRTEPEEVTHLGRVFRVTPGVFAPTPVSDLLGTALLAEVGATDRVLDMGTGCGTNAILAAGTSADVVAVDVNPEALACARRNADRLGVASRIRLFASNGFTAVAGVFDLVVVDPPFRWFRPRDLLEASIADEGYRFLGGFVRELPARLTARGRALVSFGTSGDLAHLERLVVEAGLERETVASRSLSRDGMEVVYVVLRLRRRDLASG